MLRACVIHQDAADHLRGDRVEMRPVAPLHFLLMHHAHEGFVHQCGALQGVVGTLAPQVGGRQPAQLAVHQGHQLFERVLVSLTPVDQ